MSAPADPREILAATTLIVREGPFTLGAWGADLAHTLAGLLQSAPTPHPGVEGTPRRSADPPRGGSPSVDDPCLVMRDDRETTALLPAARLADLPPPRSREDGFALVTLSMPMAWDVVGVLATLAAELASRQIPLGAYAAFSRDHLIVPAARLQEALEALAPLCAGIEHPGGEPSSSSPPADFA